MKGRPFDSGGPVKWAYSTSATSLAPPGMGPAIVVVSNDRVLHSVERGSTGGTWPIGPPRWTPLVMNAPAQSRPPVVSTSLIAGASRVIFLGAQDGYVYAVNAETGSLLWQSSVRLGEMVQAAPAGMFTAFGGAYDYILVGTRSSTTGNRFYALKPSDGTVVGSPFDNLTGGDGTGAIGIISGGASVDYPSNRVYFASRDMPGGSSNTLWCLNLTAGGLTFAWAASLGNIDGSPVLRRRSPTETTVYVGTNAGVVQALDAASGTSLWTYGTGDGLIKGFLFPDRLTDDLYFSTKTKVWGLSDLGASAAPNWPAIATIPSPSTPLFTPGGTYVLVGGADGRLYQIGVSTPTPTVTFVTLGDGSGAAGSPSLDVTQNISYIGSEGGVIYAVQLPLP